MSFQRNGIFGKFCFFVLNYHHNYRYTNWIKLLNYILGLRKSTLTVRPAMYTETKIITQDEVTKPSALNHTKTKKKPKASPGDAKQVTKTNKIRPAKTEPQSEESPTTPSPSKLLPQKYVLFVGNLPYSVTKEQLEEHFRKTGGCDRIGLYNVSNFRLHYTPYNKGLICLVYTHLYLRLMYFMS